MAIRVLLTGFDQAVKALGPTVVAGLKTYGTKHGLEIEASWKQGATPEESGSANIVVLNPASRNRDYDNAILAAAPGLSYRVFILADTWLAWRRVAKEHLAHDVVGTNVCFKGEVEAAYAHGYKNVNVIIPPHWGKMYEDIVSAPILGPDTMLPVENRGNARRGALKVIYFGGAKNPPLMNKIIGAIADGMPANAVLAFGPHPREWDGVSEAIQDMLLGEREAALARIPTINVKTLGLYASARVANADVSVFVGGPTDSIGAVYARRPMIYFNDEDVVAHNLRQDLPDGKWFVPERKGAAYANERNMQEQLSWLLRAPNALRSLQEKNFPLPETWDTAPAMVAAILGR